MSISPHVNLKVLKTSMANLFYYQHYNQSVFPVYHPDITQVAFTKVSLSLQFDHRGHCTQELELPNIGVVNFRYNGSHKTTGVMDLYVKDSQEYVLRSPLYPLEKKGDRKREFVSATRLVKQLERH